MLHLKRLYSLIFQNFSHCVFEHHGSKLLAILDGTTMLLTTSYIINTTCLIVIKSLYRIDFKRYALNLASWLSSHGT